jgi:hypothetical protein
MCSRNFWMACPTMVSIVLGAACTSAWNQSGPPPFTAVEINRALAPVSQLKVRCYDVSASRREKRRVQLEFEVHVNEQGAVHSEPVAANAPDPKLIDCMRLGLDAIRFPANRKPDQLHLSFEMAP